MHTHQEGTTSAGYRKIERIVGRHIRRSQRIRRGQHAARLALTLLERDRDALARTQPAAVKWRASDPTRSNLAKFSRHPFDCADADRLAGLIAYDTAIAALEALIDDGTEERT